MRLLAAALRSFEEDAGGALADLQMQINRVLEWIHHDRKEYWAERVRRGHQEVAEAKQNLERRLIFRATKERPLVPRGESGPGKGQTPPGGGPGEGPNRSTLGPQHRTRDPRVPRKHQSTGRLGADRSAPGLRMLQRMSLALDAYVNLASPEEGAAVDWMAMIAEASACAVAGTAAEEELGGHAGRRVSFGGHPGKTRRPTETRGGR